MDPLTQGTIGAVLPQALGKKNLGIEKISTARNRKRGDGFI